MGSLDEKTVTMQFDSFRAFSAKEAYLLSPGPMAQASTFRAFGAETRVLRLAQVDCEWALVG